MNEAEITKADDYALLAAYVQASSDVQWGAPSNLRDQLWTEVKRRGLNDHGRLETNASGEFVWVWKEGDQ